MLTALTSKLAMANNSHANKNKARPVKVFAHPERIKYDGDCFQIEGKDTFILSAAFHYFRTPKALWGDRIAKIKAAGFNTIETYVPWNWHERDMPKGLDDYSKIDLSELGEFLDLVHNEFDMYSIVRPGPFICAEWAGGGYPRWLPKFSPDMTKKGQPRFWLRSGDQAHIDWCQHWYKAVCPFFATKQLSRVAPGKKGIILIQIENEYNHNHAKNKVEVLKGLYQTVKDSGIDIPVFTCLSNNCRGSSDPMLSQVFDSDNYYVGHNKAGSCAHRMSTLKLKQPDAPGMVTELQGGWFSLVGGWLSEDMHSKAAHYNAVNMMSLLGGATVLNPYMFVGGTHFAGWGARGQTTSYDYFAAIRECGAVGAKYLAACGVSQFIAENEKSLLRAHGGPCELEGAPKEVVGGVRIAPDGTRFVFFHNSSSKVTASGDFKLLPSKIAKVTEPVYNINQHGEKVLIKIDEDRKSPTDIEPFTVSCVLKPMDAKVLVIAPGKKPSEGVWYPKKQAQIKRPATLPAPIRFSKVLRHEDAAGGNWKSWKNGVSLPELGVSDQRYVRYRTTFELSADEAKQLNKLLINSFSRDLINAQINGKVAKRTFPSDEQAAKSGRVLKTSFTRITDKDFDNRFDISTGLVAGKNTITLIYENIGFEHGYVPMEELSGISRAGLSSTEKGIEKLLEWEISLNLGGIEKGWLNSNFAPTDWEEVTLDRTMVIPRKGNKIQPKGQKQEGLLTWYKLDFELVAKNPKVWVPWLIRINASGNGYMWLNGHNLGRHYEFGPQRDWFLPECWLNFGKGTTNTIMIGLRQTNHGATIKAVEVRPYENSAEIK